SKPVMWSVVERTALAEAEIEYQDHESDTIWVKFPIVSGADDVGLLSDLVPAAVVPDERGALAKASVIIWTTTPWTIPANRALSSCPGIPYGLYEVTDGPEATRAKLGDTDVLANHPAAAVFSKSQVSGFKKIA